MAMMTLKSVSIIDDVTLEVSLHNQEEQDLIPLFPQFFLAATSHSKDLGSNDNTKCVDEPEGKKELCKYYKHGICKYSKECRFDHPEGDNNAGAVANFCTL